MTQHIIDISICMGSSCFSRGNRTTLDVIKAWLRHQNLEDRVNLKGNLCGDHCKLGPIMHIDGERFEHVTPNSVTDILNHYFERLDS